MPHGINKLSKPAIPCVQLYDSGTQAFTVAGEFHTWDMISFKTSDFHYKADDDRIMVHRPSTGYYEITFECSFTKDGAGLGTATTQIYKNGVAIDGAIAFGCAYDTGQGQASCACMTLHFMLYLNGRDYIQVKTTASDDIDSVAETSRLLIKFIPTRGWNNNAAGNINYRGEVMR